MSFICMCAVFSGEHATHEGLALRLIYVSWYRIGAMGFIKGALGNQRIILLT